MLHSPPEYDDATMAGNTGHGPAVGRLARDGDAQAKDVSEPWLESMEADQSVGITKIKITQIDFANPLCLCLYLIGPDCDLAFGTRYWGDRR